MPAPFLQLTLEQFAERLDGFTFTRPVTAVHMHHTWSPTRADYTGLATIEAMWRFHTAPPPAGRGWQDIAQHLSIAPDGTVWTGRDWNRIPASATGYNEGAFMFETIGDFDVGHDALAGAQRQAVIEVIARVQRKCGLPADALHFHREYTDQKTCPGTGIHKPDILAAVRARRDELTGGARVLAVGTAGANGLAAASTSRHVSVTAAADAGTDATAAAAATTSPGATRDAFTRPFADGALAAAPPVDEGEPPCGAGGVTDDAAARAARASGNVDAGATDFTTASTSAGTPGAATRGGLTPDQLELLRRHAVNLRQGHFSDGGLMRTTPTDVDALFHEHLPRALAEARGRGEPLRVVFWAHGGLVDESSGLHVPLLVAPWWIANHVYPIYFVWETGFWETLSQLLGARRDLIAAQAAARDLWDFTDRPLEDLARAIGGGKLWDGMKQSAWRASQPDGGARYVARQLAAFCKANPGQVELHAAGHSAGAIFHAHFIPAALDEGAPPFRTLGFLAPAIRVAEFQERLAPHLGRDVGALTLFTMKQDLERADNCGGVYHKSLLYLIHNALEARRGEPILGLEESIRADASLVSLFGLAGKPATAHEVVWSKTAAASGRSASRSTSHGGFDNDRATMESVMRRVLGAADTTSIQPFPDAATRAFTFDAALAATPNGLGTPAPAPTPSAPTPAAPPRPASALPTPALHLPGTPRLVRALCVGINYPGDANELHGCVADAEQWAAQFRALGFAAADVELVTDAAATEDTLRARLRALVAAGERAGDVVVFQYAGHGTSFPDPAGGEDQALVPVDFRQNRFILDHEIFDLAGALRDGVTLASFFDCCHSGSMSRLALLGMVRDLRADSEIRPRFIDPTPAMMAEYRRRRAQRGLTAGARGLHSAESLKGVTFSACRDDEVALEQGGHGAFTTRVAPLVGAAFTGRVTNAEFQQRIVDAFGANAGQHPGLDCASQARSWPFLGIVGTAAAQAGAGGAHSNGARADGADTTSGAPSAPAAAGGAADGGATDGTSTQAAWNTLLGPLYRMEPGAMQQLVEQARAQLGR